MHMAQRIVLALLVIAVGVLGFALHSQTRQIERLDDELDALRTRAARATPVQVLRSSPLLTSPSAKAAPAPPAPRVSVTQDELARVESAVLNLLESDHPELRAKLQAVVQEQQHAQQQQQRETRRERWVARREARLLTLSESAGVTPEQRQAILTIMLANRDQAEELRRDAQTPEAITTLRERLRGLREQADLQIRKQLTPQQYAAFQEQTDSDDDDRPPVRAPAAAE
jgi:Spy/CpxP family protein refolding chaperone